MPSPTWSVEITLPAPDVKAVEYLTGLLMARTGTTGMTGGTTTMSIRYPSEAMAREAVGIIHSFRPEVCCSAQPGEVTVEP